MCVGVCVCVCVMEGGIEKESVCASYLALKKKKKKRNSGNSVLGTTCPMQK